MEAQLITVPEAEGILFQREKSPLLKQVSALFMYNSLTIKKKFIVNTKVCEFDFLRTQYFPNLIACLTIVRLIKRYTLVENLT